MTPDQIHTLRQAARILAEEAAALPEHPAVSQTYRDIRKAVATVRDTLRTHGESL